jgi:hypothetical protein
VNKFQEHFVARNRTSIHSIRAMNATAILPAISFRSLPLSISRKEQFRQKFQRSLRSCVRRGFSVEESFGMIWEETWEEISLTEREQAELYEELIDWAKNEAFARAY